MNTRLQLAGNSKPDDATDAETSLLTKLRIGQSYLPDAGGVPTKKLLTTVPVRRPDKAEFFRCHPTHWFDTCIVEMKQDREIFFAVTEPVIALLGSFAIRARVRLTVTKQGVVLLWPIKLPTDERKRGNGNWARSALEAAQISESRWVRIAANMHLGAYETVAAGSDLGEPQWPDEDFESVLKVAAQGLLIEDEDHAAIRELLGRQ